MNGLEGEEMHRKHTICCRREEICREGKSGHNPRHSNSSRQAYHHGKILGCLAISRLLLRPTLWLLSAAHLSI